MICTVLSVKDEACRFTILALWLLAITFIPLAISTYWFLDTEPPVTVISSRVIGTAYGSQRTVVVEHILKRNRFCEGIAHRWVVNGVVYQLSPLWVGDQAATRRKLPKDPDHETTRSIVDMPSILGRTGTYRSSIYYSCNPLQRILPLIVDIPDVFIDLRGLPVIDGDPLTFLRVPPRAIHPVYRQ